MSGELSTRLVAGLSSALERRFSRRSFVGRTAVVGAAVAVGGLDFVLKPTPAYASVCGSGSTCATGWTAMCCTINDGVNQCPPGSFAGGWWKADAAGLCGGKARYYIDCQGECTHCGCSGSSFCTEGCWNCTRHCASGTCDERRVCWNVFRYGQCHQEIGCGGPVLCRMISCVPPWQFADCTTAVATDNNTTDHSAPCLSPWSTLQAQYAAQGGPGSAVGPTVGAEYGVAGGRAQDCTNGRFLSGAPGGFAVLRPILTAYDAAGGAPVMGIPTSVQARQSDGSTIGQLFDEPAAIYTVTGAGTFAVLRSKYVAFRTVGPTGIGYPVAASAAVTGGSVQRFQRGAVVESGHGAFALWGPVYDRWVAAGAQGGSYGFPTSSVTGSGRVQQATFVGGTITTGAPPPRTLNRG